MNPYDVEKKYPSIFLPHISLVFLFFSTNYPPSPTPSQSGSSHNGAMGVHAKWIIPRWSSETISSGAVWSAFSLDDVYLATLPLARESCPAYFTPFPQNLLYISFLQPIFSQSMLFAVLYKLPFGFWNFLKKQKSGIISIWSVVKKKIVEKPFWLQNSTEKAGKWSIFSSSFEKKIP